MVFDQDDERAVESIRLPLWGRVVASDGAVPWLVVDRLCGRVDPVVTRKRNRANRNHPGPTLLGLPSTPRDQNNDVNDDPAIASRSPELGRSRSLAGGRLRLDHIGTLPRG